MLRAQALKLPAIVQADPRHVPAGEIADGTDLIVAAHTHARVDADALAKSRLGGIGYHPSLLPRHRGIAAVEWTIKSGDAIAGGSIYHLAERMDAGAIAAQDWCFVKPGETARELWERALAPMGLALLARVVRHVRDHDEVPAFAQDERFATPERPAYEAKGGYSGAAFAASLTRRFRKIWVGGFARYESLKGVAFEASPLMRRDYAFTAGMAPGSFWHQHLIAAGPHIRFLLMGLILLLVLRFAPQGLIPEQSARRT